MKKILLSLVGILISLSAYASDDLTIGKGTHEITGSSGMDISHSPGTTVFILQGSYGYFLTNWFEPQIALGFAIASDFDAEVFSPVFNFYYNKGQKVLPFVGIGTGVISAAADLGAGSVRETSFLLSLGTGVTIPITKNVGYTATVSYSRTFSNGGSNTFSFTPIGFTLFF